MSMNPPNLGADLPTRLGPDPAGPLSADATDSDWSALPDEQLLRNPHDAGSSPPHVLTPAVLRVLEWHRARSTAHH